MFEHQKETQTLLRLMRAALRQDYETPLAWDAGCDAARLEALIRRQSLVTMVYPVVARQEGTAWAALRAGLDGMFARESHRAITQEYEIRALLDDLERDGIDCLPMKGWVMRRYYPDPLMRSMGDFDVLIREMDSRRMKTWMEKRGYTMPAQTDQDVHDTYIKPPYMCVEMHRSLLHKKYLFKSEKAHVDAKERGFWEREKLEKGKKHTYRLSDEDFYIYCLSHFYKHFTVSGVGIRFLVDLYVFCKSHPCLDQAYIKAELQTMHLLDFAQSMQEIAHRCFETAELDGRAWTVLEYLTSTTVHGDRATREILYVVKRGDGSFLKNKAQASLRRCFPDYEFMRDAYPELERNKWKLPYYWAARLCRIAFMERDKITDVAKAQSKDEYDKIKEVYQAAGIIRPRRNKAKKP